MNWDDLRILLAVSRQSKLDRVAISLGIDATTISRRLKRLEETFGETFFERTRRGHILTPRGEIVVRRAEAMESNWLAIERSGIKSNLVSGRVRLGVTEGLGATVIAPMISEFSKQWPAIDVDLIALSGFVSVSKREADMSILLARPRTGRLKVQRLKKYMLHLYGSKEYIESNAPITDIEALQQQKLISYVDDLIYSPQLRYFDEVFPGLQPQYTSTSILAQLEMTRSGAGLCILPSFIAARHSDLVPVLAEEIRVERSFWLVVHEDVANFSRIRAVKEAIMSSFEQKKSLFTTPDLAQ